MRPTTIPPQDSPLIPSAPLDTAGSRGNLLATLSDADLAALRAVSSERALRSGTSLFRQGELHEGIFIILAGRVRTYYTGASGREITLAYWPAGHFVGGPEIFGGSPHVWSGEAVGPVRVLHARGAELRAVLPRAPGLAVALLEAVSEKGRCYSEFVQTLGTRSASERLAHLLLHLSMMHGRPAAQGIAVGKRLSQEDMARLIGTTRQWVAATLKRFSWDGIIDLDERSILIRDQERLRRLAG